MGFIQENNIVLNIGLSKEYRLVHFSDVHVATYDDLDTEEEINKVLNQEQAWIDVRIDFAKHFNETCASEQLVITTKCLDNLIEYSNNINPDCVLLSGDIIDYYSRSNYNYLKESLLRLNGKYLFACGNHESPSNLYNEICNNNCEISNLEFDDLLIVSLDNSGKTFSIKQLDTLKELIKLNKPIILLMHIPIVTKFNEEEMSLYDSYFVIDYDNCDENTLKFIELILSNELIKAIFCGHTHGASVSSFGLNKPQFCASSGLIGYVNNIILK